MHDRGKRLPAARHLQDKTSFAAAHKFFAAAQLTCKIVNLPVLINRTHTFDYSQYLFNLYKQGF